MYLREDAGYDFAVVGGIPTDIILNGGEMVEGQKIIRATKDDINSINLVRPNGTQRDLDIKLFTDDAEDIKEFLNLCRDASADAGSHLITSVSGYETKKLDSDPWFIFTSKLFRNYADSTIVLAAGGVEVSMPAGVIEDLWTVEVDGSGVRVPVLSPAVHRGFYRTRFLHGDKSKDRTKLSELDLAIARANLSAETTKLGSPFVRFSEMIKQEMTLMEALKSRRIRRVTQALGVGAFAVLERNEGLIRAAQDEDSKGVAAKFIGRALAQEQKTYSSQ